MVESAIMLERPTIEAAKVLAASVAASHSDPPSPSSRVLLGIPEDKEWLSDMDCFVRHNLEVFCATQEDVDIAQQDRKYPVNVGQVGIRCIRRALAKEGEGARGSAVAYLCSIGRIYKSIREFQKHVLWPLVDISAMSCCCLQSRHIAPSDSCHVTSLSNSLHDTIHGFILLVYY